MMGTRKEGDALARSIPSSKADVQSADAGFVVIYCHELCAARNVISSARMWREGKEGKEEGGGGYLLVMGPELDCVFCAYVVWVALGAEGCQGWGWDKNGEGGEDLRRRRCSRANPPVHATPSRKAVNTPQTHRPHLERAAHLSMPTTHSHSLRNLLINNNINLNALLRLLLQKPIEAPLGVESGGTPEVEFGREPPV